MARYQDFQHPRVIEASQSIDRLLNQLDRVKRDQFRSHQK
ncbi:hypothetical protein J2S00_002682 [Caldalkalibacillus uzonensis]|uniref:Aspartyl-phosphate phosphatase Spo0E family protein n=2 Tax=Caldalkalibacillus uzonensis TaxID=353224 RepID=A0ABU0CXC8_9BACI|nr:hypothetical protein [Caldalkalibacillus uzonensis]